MKGKNEKTKQKETVLKKKKKNFCVSLLCRERKSRIGGTHHGTRHSGDFRE
jgi:hypothetical protein